MFARRAHAVLLDAGNQPGVGRSVCSLHSRCGTGAYPASRVTAWGIHLLRFCVAGWCAHLCPDQSGCQWIRIDLSMDRQQKTPDLSRAFVHPRTRLELKLVRPEGFEPPTNGFGSHYSIRLSYERLAAHYARTAGMRVMGPGGAGPGGPRRHSRRHDTGLSARAVAGSQPDAQVRAHRIQAVQRCRRLQAAVPRTQASSTSPA